MKKLIAKLIELLVRIDWFWALINTTLIPFSRYAESARIMAKFTVPISRISPDMTVRHGVFAGMKYPKVEAAGSVFFPKLIGSYEKEIEPILEQICSTNYTEIVNIGCAEGYYAVGLAMRIKNSRVYAFDLDRNAIQLCEEMASLNNVSDRVITGGFCDPNTLKNIPFTEKALIISDCEGYEKELFTNEIVALLSNHEVLIEVHDFIDIEISTILRDLFYATHTIDVYNSIDDIKKAQQYKFDELDEFDLETKKIILGERRPAIMEWFYFSPRK